MKRIICVVLIAVIFLCPGAYAVDTALFDLRNEVFEESKQIKTSLAKAKDVVLMNSMWDTCIMTMSQLDAYIYMVRIFNTIKEKDIKKEAIESLTDWLSQTKKTNELNIKSLSAITKTIDPYTEIRVKKLKTFYNKLNKQIDAEIEKILALKKSLNI